MVKPARRRSTLARPILHSAILSLISLSVLLSYHFSSGLAFHSPGGSTVAALSLPSVGPGESGSSSQSGLTSEVLSQTVRRQAAPAGSGLPQVAAQLPTATSTPALPFHLYAVAEGDTASSIAATFGIDLKYLLAANADLRDGELLTVGQMLIVPAADGVLYHVAYGETLSDVADRFGVTVDDIMSWEGNGISSSDQVTDGQLVFVPNGQPPPVYVAPQPTAQPPVAVSAAPAAAAPVAAAADSSPPPPPPAAGPSSSEGLIWPVTGPISSYMGPSHPLGIDIDLYATPYTDVHAATSGTVTFAGGDSCCSYGYYVIVMSPGGIETLYAHFSDIAVSTGQQVSQGDVLGTSGCTGNCTGPHLHFEVIDNGVRVNPLDYLP